MQSDSPGSQEILSQMEPTSFTEEGKLRPHQSVDELVCGPSPPSTINGNLDQGGKEEDDLQPSVPHNLGPQPLPFHHPHPPTQQNTLKNLRVFKNSRVK